MPPTLDQRERALYTGQPVECYRFALGATVYRWTSADATVVLPEGTYTPLAISRSASDLNNEDHAGSVEVAVPATAAIVQPFTVYLPNAPVALTVYRAHVGDEANAAPIFVGVVVGVSITNKEATLTCAPFNQAFKYAVPGLAYSSRCAWSLFSAGCGVSASAYRKSAMLSSVSGLTVRSVGFYSAGQTLGYYVGGWMEKADGDRRYITTHTGAPPDTVTIMNPFPSLSAGEVVYVYPGCERTEAVCASRFNNLARHLGFPRVPSTNPFKTRIS